MTIISGQELFNWQKKVAQQARNHDIDLTEITLLITELTDLDSLSLKLGNYQQRQINSQVSLAELEHLWQLRIQQRCPLQYLLGECYWRNFRFQVTPDVLIPRPETELIIDLVAEIVQAHPHFQQGKFLDLGTGSGAIAIGLADMFPQAQIYAVDYSHKALAIAQENALRYQLQDRIVFCHGSWFEPLNGLKNSFSVIVSNPPYIPSELVLQLQPEVVNHEPKTALDGGADGLDDIRHLINSAPEYLQIGGFLLLEIMAGQGKSVQQLILENGNYNSVKIQKDLANLDRFVMAQIKENKR